MLSELVNAFNGFAISLDEYLNDGGESLLHKAEEYLAVRVPEIPPEARCVFLLQAIRRRCLSILSDKTKWIESPRGHRSELECAIEGQTVTGSAVIEPKKIAVSMNRDGIACSKECRLLDWAPRLFTMDPFIGSPANEEGERCAKELFLMLILERLSVGCPPVLGGSA